MSNTEAAQTAQTSEAASQKTNESSSQPTNKPSSQSKPTIEATLRSDATESNNSNSNVRTVKVSNVSLKTDKMEIREFFSFSGEIQHVEMQKESEATQMAFVTYKEPQGAETALCLSGATISNLTVTITPVENYQLPPDAVLLDSEKQQPSPVHKAEDVVTTMLAKGFVLGKDAVKKAKDFDEQHQLSSKASDRVVSIDRKIGFSEKLSLGTAAVNEKAREMDQKYQVSEKTKQAYQVAEEKATTAGSAIMSNRYVMTGASWVTNAYSAVAKAAEDVSTKTKEKVEKAELERQERLAAMTPKTRDKVEKAEREKEEKASQDRTPKSKEKDEKEKAPENNKSPKKTDEQKDEKKEKQVPDGSAAGANK